MLQYTLIMNNWLKDNTIYVTLCGSQAYGLATDTSDVDVKGICMPPFSVLNHLFQKYEQSENDPSVEVMVEHLRNPKNPKIESTVFSLRKFMVLAANVNPNIIELLYTDPTDVHVFKKPMDTLMAHRDMFLSTRVKHSFSGYAHGQLYRIERHRKWILKGELEKPRREDFGLPEKPDKCTDELFGYIKSEVERWNLNQFEFDEMDRNELKETIWELVAMVSDKSVTWDNWPEAYAEGVVNLMQKKFNLKDEVVDLIQRERRFRKEMVTYNSWLKWKAERNPARRELEVKSGYDTKHASHLVRLLRMGYEILTTGQVIVKRPDAEELLAIKNGAWTYERVLEYSNEMKAKLDGVYDQQKKDRGKGLPVPLPREVDNEAVNKLYSKMCEEYYD